MYFHTFSRNFTTLFSRTDKQSNLKRCSWLFWDFWDLIAFIFIFSFTFICYRSSEALLQSVSAKRNQPYSAAKRSLRYALHFKSMSLSKFLIFNWPFWRKECPYLEKKSRKLYSYIAFFHSREKIEFPFLLEDGSGIFILFCTIMGPSMGPMPTSSQLTQPTLYKISSLSES